MTPQTDYRNRAAHVRRAARAQLAEIRRARIARKLAEATDEMAISHQTIASNPKEVVYENATVKADNPATHDFELGLTDGGEQGAEGDAVEDAVLAEMARVHDAVTPDVEQDVLESAPSGDAEPQVAESVVQTSDIDELTATEEALSTPETLHLADSTTDVAPLEVSSQHHSDDVSVADTNTSDPAEAQTPTEDALAQSDLNTLPGAGPGLVWMLHQCDITSLAELAKAETEDLSPKLGVVGEILDVSKWIDFAAQHSVVSQAE